MATLHGLEYCTFTPALISSLLCWKAARVRAAHGKPSRTWRCHSHPPLQRKAVTIDYILDFYLGEEGNQHLYMTSWLKGFLIFV